MFSSANSQLSRFKISRRGRKLQVSDDARTLVALPKEVPERIWAEVLQKDENDMVVLDIREEIIEEAMRIGYMNYMERQNALFTAHCAAEAWLKLIDWQFYRHDPGEDPSAYPPCYIPKRTESWVPDEIPTPSPKDTWASQPLNAVEEIYDETLERWPSSSSLDYPVVEEIPEEYWYPGKIYFPSRSPRSDDNLTQSQDSQGRRRPLVARAGESSAVWDYVTGGSDSTNQEDNLGAESELLQKVTDYSNGELSKKDSAFSALKTTTPVDGSLHGAGDSLVVKLRRSKLSDKSKVFSKMSMLGRSRGTLAPIGADSGSKISIISDCRIRNLRLETQYEISSEKVDSPQGEAVKRK